jgi:alpha-1,3-rhamnosyl/mannosyltransferase
MRYCLDARAAQPHFPGVGRYVRNLAAALVPLLEGDERLLVLRHAESEGLPLPDRPGVVEVATAAAGPISLAEQWAVPRIVRRWSADLYHSPYLLFPMRPGAPCVVSIHDLIPLRRRRDLPPHRRWLLAVALRRAARTARAVLTLSQASKDDLQRFLRLPAERIRVTPPAPDPIFAPPAPAAVEALRRRLGLPERYVLYVGTNRPHKNLARLVEACSRLETAAAPLVAAGPWDARFSAPKRLAETLALGERVRFLGPVADADLPALYGGADLFVFPSEIEGFGLPVVEAMACGAAVACSAIPVLDEVTAGAAATFDPTSVASIAATLARLLDDGAARAELSRSGRQRAATFTWAETARRTLAAYRSAARR